MPQQAQERQPADKGSRSRRPVPESICCRRHRPRRMVECSPARPRPLPSRRGTGLSARVPWSLVACSRVGVNIDKQPGRRPGAAEPASSAGCAARGDGGAQASPQCKERTQAHRGHRTGTDESALSGMADAPRAGIVGTFLARGNVADAGARKRSVSAATIVLRGLDRQYRAAGQGRTVLRLDGADRDGASNAEIFPARRARQMRYLQLDTASEREGSAYAS